LSASLALLCELDYFAAPVATVRFGAAAIETALNLENGGEIVLDYVDHNEARVAFEHLLYMIDEPPLVVSEKCIKILDRIAKSLKMPFR